MKMFSLQAGVTDFSAVESPVRDTWDRRKGTSDTLVSSRGQFILVGSVWWNQALSFQ